MKQYDAIVIGGGIAGSCSAYFLRSHGLRVLVLEKNTLCSGGSYAAGAFLSPKIAKPSIYKTYLNDAFSFSTAFYKEHFPDLFCQCGLEKYPTDDTDRLRCKSYEPYIDIPCEILADHYYFPDAGIIDPITIVTALLKDIDYIESYMPQHINHDQALWHVDDFAATHLILSTGSQPNGFDLPYLITKNIDGYRYDVSFDDDTKVLHNKHKACSISAFYQKRIAIGATHIKASQHIDLASAATEDRFGLLEKAKTMLEMQNLTIVKSYWGTRTATMDYFPILGNLIDSSETLKQYPYIKTGTKVPSSKYIHFPNLYMHSALGSRGFVFAPYNAHLLAKHITENKVIPDSLTPERLFKRWATKQQKN